ncbi:MAG: site-2 protease family protein [Gemmatimonadetes bacterium]|nr:site-2 protease family protein [Gemmatimonadota bacterium]
MGGIRLGKIFGLEVRVDYSWFLIFFLILWSLTMGVFPADYPGKPAGTYVAMGIVATLLFFASLLAHEISHSIVARRRGIPVEGITLFIFGGMAHTRMEAEEPADEFIIAGVGPLSSLLIALLFGVLGAVGNRLGWSPAATIVTRYLAYINVALAVFNLLPGFPLDGGRLFRAAVWKYTGDLTKATRYATNGGKLLGYALMAVGFLQMFMLRNFGGLWFVFIGWFVRTAAEASFAQHRLLRSLEGIRARDVMSSPPETVSPDLSVQQFVDEHILRGRHRAYPVVEDDHPVGLITLEQVKAVPRGEWGSRTIRDAMAPLDGVAVAERQEKMTEILQKLARSTGGRVLVVSNGHVEGLITRSDLARWLERAELIGRS